MINDNTKTTPIWQRIGRIGVRLAVIGACVVLIKIGFDALSAKIALLESDAAARAMTGMIIMVLIGYAMLLAMPFVPGVEIGIALLVIQGPEAAPFVYLATLSGLTLAFCIGQCAPLDRLIRLCRDLYLHRIGKLLERIKNTPREQRISALHDRLPGWLAAFLCDYRYVTLAIMINLPGNIALGGGGGIMMAAGLSRLFQTGFIVLTLAIATLPVPLAVWFWGADVLQ
jgi:hypothetical protein